MWMEPLSHWLVAVALLGQTTATAPPTTPDMLTTRQSVFAIPFRVDPTNDVARQPAEVQLHVSIDGGAHWQLYAKAPPTQQHFMFRAGADGEYWFAIRTVDRSGQARPETITGPGLRVRVDTQPPVTKLKPEAPKTQNNNRPVADADPAAEPKGSVAIAINPAIGKRYVAPDKHSGSTEAVPGLPPGERPRLVNSRRFELEYDVDSVGPSGIGRVELWGTRDAGKTWRNFPLDNDNNNLSPLRVDVKEEGVYGFCVVVTNGAGLGGKPPKSGDLPDLWVGIDLTKPTARIVSAQQGTDAEAGQLIISWQADDRTLAARPVTLSFSQTRTGPWLPIASGLENTGRYAWTIDGRTPPQFYLRLEVRDEAGNVGTHETTEPIAIDQSRPTIRVRDIRPISQTSVRPAQQR
jgi:hypothetical protein